MIQGLLLAAGKSTRFGRQKLIARLPEGQTVAEASVAALRGSVDNITAVVNPDDWEVIKLFQKSAISMINCPQSDLGMGHSIACGVEQSQQADAWVIALADMPFIQPSTIKSVVEALKKGALIAVPINKGRRGHPVGFSRQLRSELLQLQGDVGARELLMRYQSEVVEKDCQDQGIFIDIDTPEDLEKTREKLFTE